MSAHVEIPRPHETAPGRFTADLAFPDPSKRRAQQHHDVAWALAQVHGLDASTPYKVNRRWSIYEEQWGNGERNGWLDMRRLCVDGPARELARYLVALERVLDEVEALATRAVRVFGQWKRSVAAEPHLAYEDASTMRTRVREFRAGVLRSLVAGLGAPRPAAVERDSSRPLWEQSRAVAEEVRAAAGGVDLERADDSAVTALMARMVPAAVAEAERLAALEAARVEAERLEAERVELFRQVDAACAREADEADAERYARDGQGALFPVSEARPALVVPPPMPVKPRRAPRRRVPVAARFPEGTTNVVISREQVEHFNPGMAAAIWPEVSADRQRYAPAA
ncbi:hypothetical protein [Streptomyces griseomycini]|uniref:Uncharacterized protein n=1 Tax=Streptomyces griseomycini TaxID=66895 RepID=A0A7W7PWJ6_9ACTN|nr:hypothetical protein [Streptomyces griseomycini]MBB4902590.1 hypothetical protein [Streptomyces griseomycini]GGR54340.1 hypothetical protein GCM10015536_69610 [Streptomyces griseomycini]